MVKLVGFFCSGLSVWYFCESSCLFYLRFNFDFYVVSITVHLGVACIVYDGVFLCCPISHEMSWMRS